MKRIKTKFTAGDSFPRIGIRYTGADPVASGYTFSMIVERPPGNATIEIPATVVIEHSKGGDYTFDWRLATKTTADIDLSLDPGTTVPIGTIVESSSTGEQFVTTSAASNAGGVPAVFPVTAEAVNAGPIVIPANDLTVIPTPIAGWTAADNPLPGVTGRNNDLVEGCSQQCTVLLTLTDMTTQHLETFLIDVGARPS